MAWVNPFPGLTEAEWSDIHTAVMQGMGYVTVGITFYRASPAAVDDLYREAENGDDSYALYAEIGASIRIRPDQESLTRMGLRTEAEVLCFIPTGYINAWETEQGTSFQITTDMEVEVQGVRYNVFEVASDSLPTATGGVDTVGLVVTGWKER